MMALASPPREAEATSYRATDPLPSSQRMYQAIPDFSSPPSSSQPRYNTAIPSYRRVSVRRSRSWGILRPCALISRVFRMVLFNGCSFVLGVVGAFLVWSLGVLGVITLPLCGFGLLVLQSLLRTVFYLCCTDAFVYNALAASAADCIDMESLEVDATEQHPLLPIRIPPPVPGDIERVLEPCPRFERSLEIMSPRSILAIVYFAVFKLLVGAGQLLSVVLVLEVLGFMIGDNRVPIHLDHTTKKYPFAVYTTAFGLLLMALAMLHVMTRLAKQITSARIFEKHSRGNLRPMPSTTRAKIRLKLSKKTASCCVKKRTTREIVLTSCQHPVCFTCLSKACCKALKDSVVATCWACREEVALDQVKTVLTRSDFAQYMAWYRREATDYMECAGCSIKKNKRDVRATSCGHYYCLPCLRRMCRLALKDRALVPLRCCKKELPVDYVREVLTVAVDYNKYRAILAEKDWKISDLASDAEYTAIVKAMGAKQCPGCGIGVQRDFGCIHMTCPNGHQFCFTCVRVWGSCNCPLIPEAELRQILGEDLT